MQPANYFSFKDPQIQLIRLLPSTKCCSLLIFDMIQKYSNSLEVKSLEVNWSIKQQVKPNKHDSPASDMPSVSLASMSDNCRPPDSSIFFSFSFSSCRLRISFSVGSSLTVALVLICLARSAEIETNFEKRQNQSHKIQNLSKMIRNCSLTPSQGLK